MMMMGFHFFWIPIVLIALVGVGIIGRYLSRQNEQRGRRDSCHYGGNGERDNRV
mgnify:CR=1 FL=1